MAGRMHPDQIDVDVETVRRLITAQFPQWAELPIERVDSSGTVNAMFRLGNDKVVRLPFVEDGARGIDLEAEWLPRLAPQLPVPVPAVQGIGKPDEEYPCPWLILDWLDGEHPVPGDARASNALATDLAVFIHSMRQIDTVGAPTGYRGGSFHRLDTAVRECLQQIDDLVDVDALAEVWTEALSAPGWSGPPVWVHCDLLPGNLLVAGGRPGLHLAGVLDFATSGIGDPACDLMAAWSVLPAAVRPVFRDAVGIDDATWIRGRGWMLAQAAIALPYYRESNQTMAGNSLHALLELVEGNAQPRS